VTIYFTKSTASYNLTAEAFS